MATKQQVELFLKDLIDKIRYMDIAFRPRDKNLDALADLDITPVKRIDCMSFHIAEFPISYPLKK